MTTFLIPDAAHFPEPAPVTLIYGGELASASNGIPINIVAGGGNVNAGSGASVALYGSNPATTGVATDALVKFGAGGLTAVNHVLISNNTTINVNYELDAVTTLGSDILAPGQKIFLDVFGTLIVHLQAASSQNINGAAAGNIVVRAWS